MGIRPGFSRLSLKILFQRVRSELAAVKDLSLGTVVHLKGDAYLL